MKGPHRPRILARLVAFTIGPGLGLACAGTAVRPFSDRVQIRRTSYGVPHILAEDLAAAAYGLAWCHMEDYPRLVVERLTMARGELSLHRGAEYVESDVWWIQRHEQAVAAYPTLASDVRDLYEGYAAAVNHYISLHSDRVPRWVRADFTGPDVAAHWADETIDGAVGRFRSARAARPAAEDSAATAGDGSNAWAFGPSRTESGRSILLRNPHLAWGAGRYSAYYEAQLTVPEVIDFYGDFRVGYPMYFNGGFNRDLGWSTTNNAPLIEEFYALQIDPADREAYVLDGRVHHLRKQVITIQYAGESGIESETRELVHTELGPVVARTDTEVFVVRSADWDEFRRTEQFLRMMQASTLEEWQSAMRIRAMKESNFIYADAAGNIYYVWNAALPLLPHSSGRDTMAIAVRSTDEVWRSLVPFDSLPQLLNPISGYVHNENDSFHFTNLEEPIAAPRLNAAWPEPRLRLRSQLALELVHEDRLLSLMDVIELKHSPRMLLADRVKRDLVRSVSREKAGGAVGEALRGIEVWDNTAAAESRASTLFEIWWRRYRKSGGNCAHTWDPSDPLNTPRGLADPELAVAAFRQAVAEMVGRYGAWDVSWGDVHRIRWGDIDVPASGCPAALGCFRHLGFREAADGRQTAYTGDAWVLAVEFADTPIAYSSLVFGQTGDRDSPHYDDQTEMFARGRLKRVAFTEEEIARDLRRSYRPEP